MLGLIGRVLKLPKARIVALALFVPACTSFLLPVNSYADDAVSSGPPAQTAKAVESPSAVTATSATDDRTIVWTWAAPNGGLTPDATSPQVDSNGNPVSAEQSTDIVQFGYRLSKDGFTTTSGTVGSDILTITTPVTDNGDYSLSVWSVSRAGDMSAEVSGSTTVSMPDLVPIEDSSIPVPINAPPLVTPLIVGSANTAPIASTNTSSNPGYVINTPSASVLSANKIATDNVKEVAATGVANTSSQGWVVLGIPWYFWLLILAASYAAMRIIVRYTANL